MNKVAKPAVAVAVAKVSGKVRKKPELKFLTTFGSSITLVVDNGGELVALRDYCKTNKINFGGVKKRLIQANRVDFAKSCLKLDANDPILVQGSMRSAMLKLVVLTTLGAAHQVYVTDLDKISGEIATIVDQRNRRFSIDRGVTWTEFLSVEGATPIKLAKPVLRPKKLPKKQSEQIAS